MKDERLSLFCNNFGKVLLSSFFVFIFSFVILITVNAQSGTYDRYDVSVILNKDSTMDVTESVVATWDGTFHYISRDLTLSNSANLAQCKANSALQCGGFGYANIIGVYDELGIQVPSSQIEQSITNDGISDYLSLKWTFSSAGRVFNNEQFKYSIKYKVYGGLGYFSTYDLFYWNMLPSSRPSDIKKSTITITFPENIAFSKDNLKVFFDGNYLYQFNDASIILTVSDISTSTDFTVLYKYPKNIIQKYSSITLQSSPDPIDVNINGIDLKGVSSSITGLVPGENKLVFSSSGFDSKTLDVINLSPGEVKKINVQLDKALILKVLEVLNIVGSCCGLFIFPIVAFFIYRKWSKIGRDQGKKRTIIPEYSPPDGMRSYLVGSIKDEKVDLIDITSSIIDLAYRGYLKIREYTTGKILGFGGTKEYEFTKLKEPEGLSVAEAEILKGIFESEDKVNLSDLKYKFYKHIAKIKDEVYEEMTQKDFFTQNPDKIRNKYLGYGIGLLTLSFFAFFLAAPLFFVAGPIATTGISVFLIGITFIIVANFMPAKTEKGLRTFEKIEGFRMYMYTAERFRVQDLTPETFEKYLSYAICFKIETKWADRFKDIYKTAPEWFETDSMNTFTSIYFINSLTNFSTVAASSLTTSYSSSSSGSGSGWSGGGGFSGGFSGGGGGGGGSGWG